MLLVGSVCGRPDTVLRVCATCPVWSGGQSSHRFCKHSSLFPERGASSLSCHLSPALFASAQGEEATWAGHLVEERDGMDSDTG